MPLKLLPLQERDIPAFAALDEAAMKDSSLAQAISLSMPHGAPTRQETIEHWTRTGFTKHDTYYLKVIDTDLSPKDGASDEGRIISAAIWRFREGDHGKQTEVQASEEGQATGKQKQERKPVAPDIFAEIGRQFDEFRKTSFPGQTFFNLNILVTHPEHQSRGAGSILVKWGIDEADKRGIISVLQASEVGVGCYLKQGFEIVREVHMDLKPFGVDEVEIRRDMIGHAKSLA